MNETITPARTVDDLKDMARNTRLAPKRDDVKKLGRYHEELNPETGRTEWVVDIKLREENGDLTREGREFFEGDRAYMRAETERGRKLAARAPAPVILIDKQGNRRPSAPHLAAEAARKHGWREVISLPRYRPAAHGVAGPDGMLWFPHRGEWRPSGLWTLRPVLTDGRSPRVSTRTVQHDPDGHPWRYKRGRWVRL